MVIRGRSTAWLGWRVVDGCQELGGLVLGEMRAADSPLKQLGVHKASLVPLATFRSPQELLGNMPWLGRTR